MSTATVVLVQLLRNKLADALKIEASFHSTTSNNNKTQINQAVLLTLPLFLDFRLIL